MAAVGAEPGAAEDEEIEVAVVVDIAVDDVQSAVEAFEPGLGGGVDELAPPVVQEEPGRASRIEGRGEDVQVEVAVEVVDDGAAREVEAVDSRVPARC